jgi:FkbM family methyltransferase
VGEGRKFARPLNAETREWLNEREFLDGYLRNVTGLIHIGANYGQERRYYWLLGLDVVWVEPIREIYEALVDNLLRYPRQRAVSALLSERAGEAVTLRISHNHGESSSILPSQDHAVIFPDVSYGEERAFTTETFADLVAREAIPLDAYQALTLDVEGAELLILKGGRELLGGFRYIKCEVADFPARTGGPTVEELDAFLREQGFKELGRRPFAQGPGGEGTYWDIVWKRAEPGRPLHEPGVPLPLVFNPLEVEGIERV